MDFGDDMKGGRAFYIEVKNPRTNKSMRLSSEQEVWRDRIIKEGGLWTVVTDFEMAFNKIKEWTE